MDAAPLKLVQEGDSRSHERSGLGWVIFLSLVIWTSSVLATFSGADAARRPLPSLKLAEETVQRALEFGNRDSAVQASLVRLRGNLGLRPLNSRTRVIYSNLLLALSQQVRETEAAVFHASRAAALAPVTVPVVRLAAVVLARAGEPERSLSLVREMFFYDARSAASLLSSLESAIDAEAIERSVPESPESWLARWRQLRLDGRAAEANIWLETAFRRWPGHFPTLRQVAVNAVRREDWARLAELLPPDRRFPNERQAAPVLALRAESRAALGDEAGARSDIEHALELGGGSPDVEILVGDAFARLHAIDEARRHWKGALFRLSADDTSTRRGVLERLARLEDVHGEPAAALQIWQSILDLEPGDPEATRRIHELTGSLP